MANIKLKEDVKRAKAEIKKIKQHIVDAAKMDITKVTGYDAAKKQNLKNVTGTLTFEDEQEFILNAKSDASALVAGKSYVVDGDTKKLKEAPEGVKTAATKVALAALTGMKTGDVAYVLDEQVLYNYDGTNWVTRPESNPIPSHKDYATGTVKDHLPDLIKYMHTGDPMVLHYLSAGSGGGKVALPIDTGIGRVLSMAANSDGTILLGSIGGKTQLVDKNGKNIGVQSVDYGIGQIISMIINSDGNILLGGDQGKTQLVDKTGAKIGGPSTNYGIQNILSMTVNSDGNILLGGLGSKTQLVDKTGVAIGGNSVDYGISRILSMKVNADGNILLGGKGGKTQLVDKTGAAIGLPSRDHNIGDIINMIANSDGTILLGGAGGYTRLVDKIGADMGVRSAYYGTGGVQAMALNADGTILLGGDNNVTQLVDKTGAAIGGVSADFGIGWIMSMAVNVDGNVLLGGYGGKVIESAPKGSTALPSVKEIHTASILEINEVTKKVYALKNGVGTEVQDQALDATTHITVITIFKEDGSSGITTKGTHGHSTSP